MKIYCNLFDVIFLLLLVTVFYSLFPHLGKTFLFIWLLFISFILQMNMENWIRKNQKDNSQKPQTFLFLLFYVAYETIKHVCVWLAVDGELLYTIFNINNKIQVVFCTRKPYVPFVDMTMKLKQKHSVLNAKTENTNNVLLCSLIRIIIRIIW